MAVLAVELRKLLEKTIVNARREAEAGARNALELLAVERHEPHPSMSSDDRSLRNRLRARGRQLGDRRDPARSDQEIGRLTHEVAYEQWHRMLFARFLAENGVLVEPESGVSITVEECEELARELGVDPHALAAQFAQEILPGVFRGGDPVLDVILAPETRQALQRLLDDLPSVVFTADDSLGWTYQFWQNESKDAVNASGEKVGADELPAVTQLFTEPYMVEFLLHNTLGAWWCSRNGAQGAPHSAGTPMGQSPVPMDYLRWRDDGTPAGGTFDGWPNSTREVRVLDPCCGSGHFLTTAFHLLVPLRMHDEGLSPREACDAVLANNLFGLELDPRCTQIAAFALALAAWTYPDTDGTPLGYRELPDLNIACSGINTSGSRKEWLALADGDVKLTNGIDRLYTLFSKASELGSLIDPGASEGDLLTAEFRELSPLLDQAVRTWGGRDVEVEAIGVSAQGMARAAKLLVSQFTLVTTNVPFLGRGKQSDVLSSYCEKAHPTAKGDLATTFVERCLAFCDAEGTAALVTPQNWLFLSTYKHLRRELLAVAQWMLMARLGARAFETITGEIVNVVLLGLTRSRPHRANHFAGYDASVQRTPADKATALLADPAILVEQYGQRSNPDHRITLQAGIEGPLLLDVADSYQGICTGDFLRFGRCSWELAEVSGDWMFQQTSSSGDSPIGGLHYVLLWQNGQGAFHEFLNARLGPHKHGAWVRGLEAWGHLGVCINQTQSLGASLYTGEAFDNNAAVIVAKNPEDLDAVWAFCSSQEYAASVRKIDQKLNVTNITLLKVPFDLARWRGIAAQISPAGLPQPLSTDPTQWVFDGRPGDCDHPLQVAVARLLGYRWPRQVGHAFQDCPALASDELQDSTDPVGVVPIPAVRGERAAADRIRALLQIAYGAQWSQELLQQLLTDAGSRADVGLDEWLRTGFFQDHCRIFHQRPFIWHVWDGRTDGFHALVNAHRLTGSGGEGRRTLEALTYTYLGDWIARQQTDQRESMEGADARLAAAQDLQHQLESILEGEPPYDLFARWKPLHEQPVGWDPDINDGIRLNIRPFMNAQLRTGGRKGAGILRWKPNIKWGKDRGKEPESLRPKEDFPWFWSCAGKGSVDERTDFLDGNAYDGARWNDLHYSNAAKQAARDRAAQASNS
jgi:hypothetical protein